MKARKTEVEKLRNNSEIMRFVHYSSPAIYLQGIRGSAVGGIEKIESEKIEMMHIIKEILQHLSRLRFSDVWSSREMISTLSVYT